jgi:hypothetical protein
VSALSPFNVNLEVFASLSSLLVDYTSPVNYIDCFHLGSLVLIVFDKKLYTNGEVLMITHEQVLM